MSRAIYTVRLPFETFRFSANLAEASAPICWVDDEGEEHPTQYQTADARHSPRRAAKLALLAGSRDYYAEPGDERDSETIVDALIADAEVSS